MTTAEQYAALDNLYNQLPRMDCRGKCAHTCGRIKMTPLERQRIQDAHGITINTIPLGKEMCPALTVYGSCGIYEVRPFICHLYYLVETVPCPFGCKPEGGWISERQAVAFQAEVETIAGTITREEADRLLVAADTTEGKVALHEQWVRARTLERWAYNLKVKGINTRPNLGEAALGADLARYNRALKD
jgi:Fe-S-cluster containining protein